MPIHLEQEPELLRRITDYLQAMFGNHLLGCALIGSRANGYAKPKSDVDLHVVLKAGVRTQQLGLRRQQLLGAEVHILAILESTLRDGAIDVRRQPMENVCLTLFAYRVLWGAPYFDAVNVMARKAELVATLRWLAAQNIVGIVDPDRLLVATIIRKLIWAPPLVERWQRKMREVGIQRTWDDAALNLRLSVTAEIAAAVDAPGSASPIGGPRLALGNLLALSSRHRNLSRDAKAVVNGAIYGPPFLSLAAYEAFKVARVRLPIEQYLSGVPPEGLERWIEDSAKLKGVARARIVRNRIKDYIV
ncbi:nucleotidyltransferase domain-containing protein [Mesorhizobium sp. B2-3-11]|uniref:nucleotidyltransferase domain-containing protein n=1 Tax=Mesorhizobium sp. B2-3-11 TaxID=2589953 RepID=UPI0032B2FBAC